MGGIQKLQQWLILSSFRRNQLMTMKTKSTMLLFLLQPNSVFIGTTWKRQQMVSRLCVCVCVLLLYTCLHSFAVEVHRVYLCMKTTGCLFFIALCHTQLCFLFTFTQEMLLWSLCYRIEYFVWITFHAHVTVSHNCSDSGISLPTLVQGSLVVIIHHVEQKNFFSVLFWTLLFILNCLKQFVKKTTINAARALAVQGIREEPASSYEQDSLQKTFEPIHVVDLEIIHWMHRNWIH